MKVPAGYLLDAEMAADLLPYGTLRLQLSPGSAVLGQLTAWLPMLSLGCEPLKAETMPEMLASICVYRIE